MIAVRWALILLFSIALMFPPVWAIANWGRERAEDEHRATRPAPQKGQKDLSVGLRGLEGLVAYTVGSFVVIWPLSLWASYLLLKNIGRKRREPQPPKAAAAEAAPAELVVTREQVLGEPVASAERTDDRPVVAGPEVALDDAALGTAGDRA